MGKIKELLLKLSPRQRQIGAITLIIVGLLIIAMLASYGMEMSKTRKKVEERKVSAKKMTLLTDKVEKELWVAAEGQNIKALEKSNEELKTQVERMQKEIAEAKELAKKPKMTAAALPPLPSAPKGGKAGGPVLPGQAQQEPAGATGSTAEVKGAIPYPASITHTVPPPPGVSAVGPGKAGAGKPSWQETPVGGTIRKFGDEAKKGTDSTKMAKKKKEPTTYLPAGSFMRAVLLSGLDAPTAGGKTSAEPYPVLMGVTDLSVLPNRFKMNLKECFVIGAGVGNVSDERAYIRTETLSCVRTDGKVIEIGMKGQVMGEDGKLGLRGRLVSKQGQQIAMAIFAGTLSGIATAIKPTSNTTLQLTTGTQTDTHTSFSRPDVGDVMQSAGLGGTGKALEMVAQYYMRMAERLFPIIEIDAGREVELVLLKGQELKISGSGLAKR
ncbi:MAG TPA: TrbI/VirB10 family protein [Syntrophales bacterium]|nr:TrbI/VirB10 family protein [Syntrophales bacterium]